MATPEFRLWSAYVCPRPLTSPLDVTPRVQDIGCLRTRGFIAANVWVGKREKEVRWGIEFQSIVNMTPGRVFPWSDVYSWFASLPTPNTWTHRDKQTEIWKKEEPQEGHKCEYSAWYFNINTIKWQIQFMKPATHDTDPLALRSHMRRIIDNGERRCWEVQ